MVNIAGVGGKFCGGFGINVFTRVHQTGDVSLMPDISVELVSNMMEEGKQPSVAAIPGLGLDGGLELTMSCQAQISTPAAHTIGSLVNNVMASHAHVVGQGIIGRSVFSGNHQWIVHSTTNGHGLSSKVVAEVNNQFRVGIQTTAIILVLLRGVLQLGSTGLVMGNTKFVMFAKKLCSQLNNRSSQAASASAENTSRQHGQSLIDNAIVSTSTPPNVLLIASLLRAAQQNGHPEFIGKTPMVYLNSVADGCVANIAAKLEYMEPCGSVKDRIGLSKINDDEEKGILVSLDKTILGEPTTGNTSVATVFVATARGYKLLATMPSLLNVERHILL